MFGIFYILTMILFGIYGVLTLLAAIANFFSVAIGSILFIISLPFAIVALICFIFMLLNS